MSLNTMSQNGALHTAPFSCTFSSRVPEVLNELGCSLVLSSHQAGKLIFISPNGSTKLVQFLRNFNQPMGIAMDSASEKMAVASRDRITIFRNSSALAKSYPKSPGKYDALYLPQMTLHTGAIDMHDLCWGTDGLYGISTSFSCIVTSDDNFSFSPYWSPPFIDELVAEDRCHLNGLALHNGRPKYVTMFNQGNTLRSWKKETRPSGIIMDIETNEMIVSNLGMPHSPIIIEDTLYVLCSSTGELVQVDTQRGSAHTVYNFQSFVRGMAVVGDYLFVATSKIRDSSSPLMPLSQEVIKHSTNSGIKLFHLPSVSLHGQIDYHSAIDEIYDVQIVHNKQRPFLISTESEADQAGITVPDGAFWAE